MKTSPLPAPNLPLATALATCAMLSSALAELPNVHFDAQTIDDDIRIGYGLAIGDVDGDGLPDILLADARYIFWYQNPGRPGEPWTRHLMAHYLTQRDHVCIAAADINGDGKVEVAVGAQWAPVETSDPEASGAVFYLVRPEDPTRPWEAVQLEQHDPTTHRMRWVQTEDGSWHLAVLPLHGIDNNPATGNGDPARLQLLAPPSGERADPRLPWTSTFIDTGLNITHNLDIDQQGRIHAVGRQGQLLLDPGEDGEREIVEPISGGEIRVHAGGATAGGLTATIEPFHGHQVVVYSPATNPDDDATLHRQVLDDSLNQGHALALADFLGIGRPQVVAGWRNPDQKGKVGIRLYVPEGKDSWAAHTIDDNKMAAEDLAVADLDGDGRPDLIASGRATRNVVIYWNRTAKE
jgi:hypothetical protein